MISQAERKQLKALIQSGAWTAVDNFANDYINSIRQRSVVRDTEWNTLKESLTNEGQVRGITSFINSLLEEANRDD